MDDAREKALQEVTDHYETKLVEKEQQREQVRNAQPDFLSSYTNHCLVLFYIYTSLNTAGIG